MSLFIIYNTGTTYTDMPKINFRKSGEIARDLTKNQEIMLENILNI